jgi:predicted DNA-binding transcriptional regulator AlpA
MKEQRCIGAVMSKPLIQPRGLSRVADASYVGISPTTFDSMVRDGRMPPPKRINSRTIWDIRQLDEAFDALPEGASESAVNPWDETITANGNAPPKVCGGRCRSPWKRAALFSA